MLTLSLNMNLLDKVKYLILVQFLIFLQDKMQVHHFFDSSVVTECSLLFSAPDWCKG